METKKQSPETRQTGRWPGPGFIENTPELNPDCLFYKRGDTIGSLLFNENKDWRSRTIYRSQKTRPSSQTALNKPVFLPENCVFPHPGCFAMNTQKQSFKTPKTDR
jgi:hypothetical protein